ncbi:MAG: hypothetical protein IT310_07390 [Anaerolineales bacterium]|nr:hypothetical protein [Anaerolineales bacterium]
MNTDKFWIIRKNLNEFRFFARDKNARPFIDGLNLLSAGKSLSEIWEPVLLPLYSGDEENEEKELSKPIPDFSRGIFGLAISKKAYLSLQPLIANQVIFLELNTEAGLYYELDIQKVDCLDLESSIKIMFPSGKIMRIEKYNFHWESLVNVHIFKELNVVLSPDFVSNQFKKIVEENNLTGLTFHPIPLVNEE